MSKYHGRNGRVYLAATTSGAAVPVPSLSSWSISYSVDQVDATVFGDSTKTYLAGLPDASGSFSGFYDDTGQGLLAGALDGLSRRLYVYPTTSDTTKYFYGTVFVDADFDSDVSKAVGVSAKWKAASSVTAVGIS